MVDKLTATSTTSPATSELSSESQASQHAAESANQSGKCDQKESKVFLTIITYSYNRPNLWFLNLCLLLSARESISYGFQKRQAAPTINQPPTKRKAVDAVDAPGKPDQDQVKENWKTFNKFLSNEGVNYKIRRSKG